MSNLKLFDFKYYDLGGPEDYKRHEGAIVAKHFEDAIMTIQNNRPNYDVEFITLQENYETVLSNDSSLEEYSIQNTPIDDALKGAKFGDLFITNGKKKVIFWSRWGGDQWYKFIMPNGQYIETDAFGMARDGDTKKNVVKRIGLCV